MQITGWVFLHPYRFGKQNLFPLQAHLTYSYLKQFPVIPPNQYTEVDLAFIVPRVLELTYTAHDLRPWAQDLSFDGPSFAFDPTRRAVLRAELDA